MRHKAVAWPLQEAPSPSSLKHMQATDIEVIILQPNTEAAQRRRVIQIELRRWHPDKLTAKWGKRLLASEAEAVLVGVKQVAQALNNLYQL